MSESMELQPALTAEEWELRRATAGLPERHLAVALRREGLVYVNEEGQFSVTYDGGCAGQEIYPEDIPGAIALANDALPDDSPYRITRLDIECLEEARATYLRDVGVPDRVHGMLELLIAKLAALLPPE